VSGAETEDQSSLLRQYSADFVDHRKHEPDSICKAYVDWSTFKRVSNQYVQRVTTKSALPGKTKTIESMAVSMTFICRKLAYQSLDTCRQHRLIMVDLEAYRARIGSFASTAAVNLKICQTSLYICTFL
jgi:hypothetical protein